MSFQQHECRPTVKLVVSTTTTEIDKIVELSIVYSTTHIINLTVQFMTVEKGEIRKV